MEISFPEPTSRLENICTQLKETKQTLLCLCHKNNETNIIFAQIEATSKYFLKFCLLGPESPVRLQSYFSKYKVNSQLSSVIVFIFLNLSDSKLKLQNCHVTKYVFSQNTIETVNTKRKCRQFFKGLGQRQFKISTCYQSGKMAEPAL